MPVYRLSDALIFPPADHADETGLLAVGGDLRPERLLIAYSMGIFPWYEAGLPILWHSPDPRMVLLPSQLRLSRSLKRSLKQPPFAVTLDTAFEDVIRACSEAPRPGQDGTWITDEMIEGYCGLHELGFAHSVEAWDGDELVGGLYGVSIGTGFFGESMFARRSDASKISFAVLVRQLDAWGFDLIDCQVHTDHLERFGATEWSRDRFLVALEGVVSQPTRRGRWKFEAPPAG